MVVFRVSEEKVVKFLLKIQDFVMQFITVYILHERCYLFLIMYIHNINATTNYYRLVNSNCLRQKEIKYMKKSNPR